MSTELNDMNPIITQANYEEFFLLYVDNELTEQERAMVDAFIQFHPELQPELDLLMGARLEPELFHFEGKEQLLSGNIRENSIDETLLLHIDNELDENTRQSVTQKLEKDETYRRQYQLLLRTKSDPAEVIPYPNKKELYRHSVVRMRLGVALRVAAAVLVVALMGVLFLSQKDPATNHPVAATWPGKPAATTAGAGSNTPSASVANKQATAAPQLPTAAGGANHTVDKTLAAATPPTTKPVAGHKAEVATPPAPTLSETITPATGNDMLAQVQTPRISEADLPRMEAAKKITPPDVTPQPLETYDITTPAADPVLAVAKEAGNRGNIKSLLRRATRLVERRTGINTTNDDDELLIGVVAVKLK